MIAVKKPKAIALVSGGLDSVLAVKLMQDQGFEVLGLHFINPFDEPEKEREKAGKISERCGLELRTIEKGMDFIEVIRHPRYGFGSGVNPCIDCRIHLLETAKNIMEEEGAICIVTGEVQGQRPMSQMPQQMRLIEKKAGVEGILVRPLSAKLLPPSKIELDGLADRDRFEDIRGRSRKRQLELAGRYGLTGIKSGGGGCLLTDENYAKKAKDLYEHKDSITRSDYHLLMLGRHFRFDGETKAIVGRNERENEILKSLMQPGHIVFEPISFAGPTVMIEGPDNIRNRRRALELIFAYTKLKPDVDRNDILIHVLVKDEGAEVINTSWREIDRLELSSFRIT